MNNKFIIIDFLFFEKSFKVLITPINIYLKKCQYSTFYVNQLIIWFF